MILSYYGNVLIHIFSGAPSDPPNGRFSGEVKSVDLPNLESVPNDHVTTPQSTPQKPTNSSNHQSNEQSNQLPAPQPTVNQATPEMIELQLMVDKPAIPIYQFDEFVVMESFNESIFKYNLPMSYIDKDGSSYIGQVWELGKSKFIFQESKF